MSNEEIDKNEAENVKSVQPETAGTEEVTESEAG